MLAAGVMAARAPFVMYAEEHSFPPPNLAEVVIREMTEGEHVAALGWAMMPANPGLMAWAHLYGQFGGVVAPIQSGPAIRLGGHHAAYRRTALLEYGSSLHHMMDNEAVLHDDFERRGVQMYITGEIVALHTQLSDFFSYLRHEFIAQRVFATARMTMMKWSPWRRLLYIAGSPLIPFVRLRSSLKDIRRTRRSGELMPQIAFVLLVANFAGAAGEALGYVLGVSDDIHLERMAIELDRYSYVHVGDRAHLPTANLATRRDGTSPEV